VYSFYKNNIWKPKVNVKKVDFPNGIAELEVNGKPFILRGDSSYLIAFDWGIKFGFTVKSNGQRVYDRIEILKRNMVQKVVREAGEVSFTGFDEKTYWNDAFDNK
jgi:hypothetical protein